MKRLTEVQRVRLAELESPDGSITPETVVNDARNEDSPLHKLFEWDDSKAAEKYRIVQARQILRVQYPVVTETQILKVAYYTHNPLLPGNIAGYTKVATLRTQPTAARESIRAEVGRAESALLRAKNLSAVLGHEDILQELIDKLRVVQLLVDAEVEGNGETDTQ